MTQTRITVRGYHLDLFGHVNNARYLEFLEEARWQAFENRMDIQAMMRQGLAFTVVNININYRRAATLNDKLAVDTQLIEIKPKSAVLAQAVRSETTDTLVADATVTFVIVDGATGRAVPLDGDIKKQLEAFGREQVTEQPGGARAEK